MKFKHLFEPFFLLPIYFWGKCSQCHSLLNCIMLYAVGTLIFWHWNLKKSNVWNKVFFWVFSIRRNYQSLGKPGNKYTKHEQRNIKDESLILSQCCAKQASTSSVFSSKSYMTFGSKDESHIFNYSIFYLLYKLRCKTLNLHRKMEKWLSLQWPWMFLH